ncbi:MAG: hypothetical protein IK089_05965 [Oxalobacter sp.]|nr:hypothetical protein [Oxalobacter sp.]
MSRLAKFLAFLGISAGVLAIAWFWLGKTKNAELPPPAGVQVLVRSTAAEGTSPTQADLPALQKRFTPYIVDFLSQQEALQGLTKDTIHQNIASSARLIKANGQSIALFQWQMASLDQKRHAFITLAYGNHSGRTHRILCADNKPINLESGKCAHTIASVFQTDKVTNHLK